MDDAELVGQAREGDLTALARLLGLHRRRLLAVGTGMLRDRDAAAEIAQETALVALTELHRLRAPELAGAATYSTMPPSRSTIAPTPRTTTLTTRQ